MAWPLLHKNHNYKSAVVGVMHSVQIIRRVILKDYNSGSLSVNRSIFLMIYLVSKLDYFPVCFCYHVGVDRAFLLILLSVLDLV